MVVREVYFLFYQLIQFFKKRTANLFVIGTVLLFSHQTFAAAKFYALQFNYSSFSDIQKDSNSEARELTPEVSANLDLRMYRVVILQIQTGSSFEDPRTSFGLGFKFELPGFFMLNGRSGDLVRKRKRRGINTAFYFKKLLVQLPGQEEINVADQFGFSADTFVTKAYFINWDIGIYSFENNQYFTYSIGLGYEF